MSFEITVPHSQCASPTDDEALKDKRDRIRDKALKDTRAERRKKLQDALKNHQVIKAPKTGVLTTDPNDVVMIPKQGT